jgi:hypothetical protein
MDNVESFINKLKILSNFLLREKNQAKYCYSTVQDNMNFSSQVQDFRLLQKSC